MSLAALLVVIVFLAIVGTLVGAGFALGLQIRLWHHEQQEWQCVEVKMYLTGIVARNVQ